MVDLIELLKKNYCVDVEIRLGKLHVDKLRIFHIEVFPSGVAMFACMHPIISSNFVMACSEVKVINTIQVIK